MFIPEFWCGVAATVLTEFVAIIIVAIAVALEPKKTKQYDEEDKS